MNIVLTGGPCTGKTTLIEELKTRGYETIPEAARIVMNEKGGMYFMCPFDSARFVGLQRQIILKQIELETKVSDKGVVFFDRSSVDSIAYAKFYDTQIPAELKDYASKAVFDYVFVLDKVREVEHDGIRFETSADAIVIHGLISMVYEEFGKKIIRVPAMPVSERADFILKYIGGKHGS